MSLLQIHEPGQTPLPHAEDCVAVGIDLGTTHSVIAISRNQQVEVIKDEHGHSIIPSVVAYGNAPVVGADAKQQQAQGEAAIISSVKRLMGRSAADIHAVAGQMPFELVDDSGALRVVIGKRTLTPTEVSADILRHLKRMAERAVGKDVKQAVITVPAYFDDAARTATKDAARLAGLDVLRLINEPTAAALAYGLEHAPEGVYAIYDLGGGTFDISILKLEKGLFQVLSTGGNAALGGDDIDHALAEWISRQSGAAPETAAQLHQLLAIARGVKESLSEQQTTQVAWLGHSVAVARGDLEALMLPLITKTIQACELALQDAGLAVSDVQGVVLVGGSTRIPLVQQQVETCFGKPALRNINPDEVVAVGAAIQAEALTVGADHLLLDVVPLSLGIETMGGLAEKVIYRNTPIPVSASQEFTTYQDGQTAMKIHVVQGERELVDQCRSLANFTLKGIPPLPANIARIRVTFTVDADGLLTVSAQELHTGTQQQVEVKPSYGLEIHEIETMLRDSMDFAQQDIFVRMLIESKVEAERLIHDLQAAIKRDSTLLEPEEKRQIDARIQSLRNAISCDDRDWIDMEVQRLAEISNPFAQRRMDKAIGSALQGSHIDDYEAETVREAHA